MNGKNIIKDSEGNFCHKKALSIVFGLAAIFGMFLDKDAYLVLGFLAASIGKSAMTIQSLNKNQDATNS
jgi:hypothetical protein